MSKRDAMDYAWMGSSWLVVLCVTLGVLDCLRFLLWVFRAL